MSGTPDGDDDDPLIGRVFASRYRIEAQLGSGAMGTVYKARHVKVGRPFAVKMLHERLLLDDKLRKRFDREAELAGKLHHINVVGVVDVGETEDGIHFMVMEYADGVPLGSLVNGPMPAERVIGLVQQLLDGLAHAHEHGLVHRDFKPDNIIVERDRFGTERPRIVDFGIAILRDDAADPGRADRLTTAGLVLGTPHYMAPEHAMGSGIDHRIDLFALGVICYELLTGRLPFDGDGVDVARANLLTATPPMGVRVPDVTVDPLLEAFTRLLMQKDPADRPQTAKEARHLVDLIATDRRAAAAALGVELLPAVSIDAPLAGGSPVAARVPTPIPAPAISTPSTRAITLPERGPGSATRDPDGRRATTASTDPDTRPPTTGSSQRRRADTRTPLVADPRSGSTAAVRAVSEPGRDRRAASEPGRRAATELPSPRRLLGIGLGVGLAIAVVLVVVVATRGDSGGKAPIDAGRAATSGNNVIAPEVPNDAGAPARSVDAASADAATTAALPADAATTAALVIDAATTAALPIDAATTAALPVDAAGTRVDPVVRTPKPLKPPKPKPPKPPIQPVALDTSASGVAQLYGAVGRELKALDVRRGAAATSALWPRYLRIRINDALTTPEKRLEAHRALSTLRSEISAQR